MAQIQSPQMGRGPGFGTDMDLNDAIGQKYPGVVRVSLLVGVLAMSWSGVFAALLIASRVIRHLTH